MSKKERLPVKCEEGHIFLITYVTLEKGRFCLECHNKEKARVDSVVSDSSVVARATGNP